MPVFVVKLITCTPSGQKNPAWNVVLFLRGLFLCMARYPLKPELNADQLKINTVAVLQASFYILMGSSDNLYFNGFTLKLESTHAFPSKDLKSGGDSFPQCWSMSRTFDHLQSSLSSDDG